MGKRRRKTRRLTAPRVPITVAVKEFIVTTEVQDFLTFQRVFRATEKEKERGELELLPHFWNVRSTAPRQGGRPSKLTSEMAERVRNSRRQFPKRSERHLAKQLGVPRRTLARWLSKLGLK